jgi:O-acetyl-ADP-ribose deacetylase (regulator of RNase III)
MASKLIRTDQYFVPLEYTQSETTLSVSYRDLITVDADVLVSSADVDLSSSGGVSYTLTQAAGDRVREEMNQWIPIDLGRLAITGAGNLKAHRIFHAAVVDNAHRERTTLSVIREVTRRCLVIGNELGFRSIGFPALAAGAAGLSPERSATATIMEVVEHMRHPTGIRQISLVLFPRDGLQPQVVSRYYACVVTALQRIAHFDNLISTLKRLRESGGEFREDRLRPAIGAESWSDVRKEWENDLLARDPDTFSSFIPRGLDENLDYLKQIIFSVPGGSISKNSQHADRVTALREILAVRQRNVADIEREIAYRGFAPELNRQLERERSKLQQIEFEIQSL